MRFSEAVRLAFEAIRAHKLRSFLTLLGIIIAVTTLIGVVAVIEGMDLLIATRVANIGSNVVTVTRFGIITNVKKFLEAQKRRRITMDDARALATGLRGAADVGATAWRRCDVKAAGRIEADVGVRGVTPNMIRIGTEEVAEGRFISEADFAHRVPVAFIGRDLAANLLGAADPIGRSVILGGQAFRVVGIARRMGSVFGNTLDNFAMVPLSTYLKVFGAQSTSVAIHVKALSQAHLDAVTDEVRLMMRTRHHLPFDRPDDFGIVTSEAVFRLWKDLSRLVGAVAVGVTAVFLVVGGIVVMNIMLASVVERTREIGIRKALGARRRDVLMQFLVESATLSTAGGALGVAVAYGLTHILTRLTPLPFSMPLWVVATALVISASVGLFFGIYPAARAARLDPIASLRDE